MEAIDKVIVSTRRELSSRRKRVVLAFLGEHGGSSRR